MLWYFACICMYLCEKVYCVYACVYLCVCVHVCVCVWFIQAEQKVHLTMFCVLLHILKLTYIYLFITLCAVSISALNTIKIMSILLWLVTYSFHVSYESVFFTTRLKIWITRMTYFCSQFSSETFSWYHRHLIWDVLEVSISEKNL